jgi:DNA-binding transcriptional regulator YiaG
MVTAEQIKTAREKVAKESQEAFSRRFGVDQSTIARWEADGPPTRGAGKMAIERVLSELTETAQ